MSRVPHDLGGEMTIPELRQLWAPPHRPGYDVALPDRWPPLMARLEFQRPTCSSLDLMLARLMMGSPCCAATRWPLTICRVMLHRAGRGRRSDRSGLKQGAERLPGQTIPAPGTHGSGSKAGAASPRHMPAGTPLAMAMGDQLRHPKLLDLLRPHPGAGRRGGGDHQRRVQPCWPAFVQHPHRL